MSFPLLVLVADIATVKEKPFVLLSGQLLLDGSQSVETVVGFVKAYPQLRAVSVAYKTDESYTVDDAFTMLNNGVSTLFVDERTADMLVDAGIPHTRLTVSDGSVYRQQYPAVREFSERQIHSLSKVTGEDFANTIISALKTDRADGLFSTLVVDVYERCLGLVYSSEESIRLAIEKKAGVYYSRSRNEVWEKGRTSGNTQELLQVAIDCDGDALRYVVDQRSEQGGMGNFCHLNTPSCFGSLRRGLESLEQIVDQRIADARPESYTLRLVGDTELLNSKIKEEADEVIEAITPAELQWEVADLLYFLMVKMRSNNVTLKEVEANLNMKHMKITRRPGNAKPKYLPAQEWQKNKETPVDIAPSAIYLNVVSSDDEAALKTAITRPIQKTTDILGLVEPIIKKVIEEGDNALTELTARFDGVKIETPVLEAPFGDEYLKGLTEDVRTAIDISMENVRKFHAAQLRDDILKVETQPGVVCTRFPRPIEKVGLYVPGGTAVLPSTAVMLGVPAQVAGCKEIVIASPPRKSDGKISPEVVYVASKIGASKIVLAGGAQAVAALAYGTHSVPKVDKILGPGNQFVTAAKMYVQNDMQALCAIDMPAGPSEVLVICDESADADFVAADLLSQAEHGADSQVILIGANISDEKVHSIQAAVHHQAISLPRVDIIRKSIAHSSIILSSTAEEAFALSNRYAPEHLILHLENASEYLPLVDHAGSVFVGAYTPESCGDYSSGTNHTLPTYGYARQYSGVNTATFQKFVTSQEIYPEGLQNIGHAVMSLAKVEGLDAHRNAVKIRMAKLKLLDADFD
ncbi:AFR703Wp [Eremothecium gossypii ATCC 10895]|uniref:Histidine biosynthesis trifunctional protein n=1 Tax=Eremothecium gossypii (strain ATCC 10895 / CBS 109.51 / FGSC 9923 / NRRL Y-1056) TaxID=284811 RepID=Q751X2_EREGS|nr:AFR703Wp [Eremothecium gossypii ATCC 10895]AAS54075.2 AFR703Wp [Eremothecium gossypii ATCC 10895]AEY98390.1 FAFR703Wp [Eremothecium gossypii FDAG1]